jgi:hypothetical protein
MQWLEQWRGLSTRLGNLIQAAELTAHVFDATGRNDHFSVVRRSLLPELGAVHASLREYRARFGSQLPAEAREALDEYLLNDWRGGGIGVGDLQAMLPLTVFRSKFEFFVRDSEIAMRSLTELAFEHLRRSLVVNSGVAEEWADAFERRETACEALGAVHLLSHGIWAFKIGAIGAATDLVYQEPIQDELGTVARTARALVLTEWKLVRTGDNMLGIASQARSQAALYAAGALGALELKQTRYIVLVTGTGLEPLPDIEEGGIVYRHVVIPVSSERPSVAARRRQKRAV